MFLLPISISITNFFVTKKIEVDFWLIQVLKNANFGSPFCLNGLI